MAPIALPASTRILEYDLMLSDEGLLRSASQYQAPIQEQIKGARLWQARLTLHAADAEGDRQLTLFLQTLANKQIRLPHARLDSKLAITPAPGTTITHVEISGERTVYTLVGGQAESSWVGRLLDIDGRAVMVADESATTFEAYPHVPTPPLPYALPNAGALIMRPVTPSFAMMTSMDAGLQPYILEMIEAPQ